MSAPRISISRDDAGHALGALSLQIEAAVSNLNDCLAADDTVNGAYWRSRVAQLLAVYDRISAKTWRYLTIPERRRLIPCEIPAGVPDAA